MKLTATCTVLMVGATLITAPAMTIAATDPLVYDNYPSGPGSDSFASVIDESFPYKVQTADDFAVTEGTLISGVTWHGSAFGADPDLLNFQILFYADDGGMPTGAGLADPSETALLTFSIAEADITVGGGGEYTADLGGLFEAAARTTYWISIVAFAEGEFGGPYGWYWNLSTDQLGNKAVVGASSHGVAYWTPLDALGFPNPVDMSFKLHGTAVPTPGALPLLGVAGVIRRRRRRGR